MKRLGLFASIVISLSLQAQTQSEVLEQYSGLGLPLVCITTMDGTEPTSENISHPEGPYVGASITNVVAKEARMQIYRADTLWYDSGDYVDDESGIKIKHRGNTSAYSFENKPFKLKLQKKADLIDVHEEGDQTDRRSKDWVLLNSSHCIHLPIAYKLSCLVGMEYSPRMQFVNVIINNDYRGMYLLGENVSREKEGRIYVDKEDGYIIELDAYFWNEDFSIKSDLTRFMQWTLKYPKVENLTTEQEEDIREDIQRLEASVSSYNYPEVIDVRSVARWIMVHDIMGTRDSGGCNLYVARTDREDSTLIRMPVVWDMASSSMSVPDEWSRSHTEHGLFLSRLFDNELCLDFVKTYIEEWKRIKEEHVFENMISFLDEYPSTPEGEGIKKSVALHMQRWNYNYGLTDVARSALVAKIWMTNRQQWLDENISAMESTYTGVPSINKETSARRTKELLPDGHIVIRNDNRTYYIDGTVRIRGIDIFPKLGKRKDNLMYH